jgi:hypothetical protein
MAVNAELTNALKMAKTKPMFFAFVAKGSEGTLLVEKAKIPAKKTADAKKDLGGGTIFKGRCLFEDGSLVFEVPAEPPGNLAALLKKHIKSDAGLMMDVVVRVNQSLAEGEEAESQAEGPTAPEAPPTAPPPPPGDPRAAELMHRLNAMSGGIKSALAGPNKARVQTVFATVNASLKTSNVDAARAGLDELESLIAPSTSPGAHDGADVMHRLNALSAAIKTALAGPNKAQVQSLFLAVNAAIKRQDFVQAGKTLTNLESLLQQGQALPSGDTARQADNFPARWAAAKESWQMAIETVDAQLGKLQAALKQSGDAELREIAEFGLNGVTGNHKVRLMAAIMDMDNAKAGDRAAFAKRMQQLISDFQGHLAADERVTACDENPFDVPVTVRATVGKGLSGLADALAGM